MCQLGRVNEQITDLLKELNESLFNMIDGTGTYI